MRMAVRMRQNQGGGHHDILRYALTVAAEEGNEVFINFDNSDRPTKHRRGWLTMPREVARRLAHSILLIDSGVKKVEFKIDEEKIAT